MNDLLDKLRSYNFTPEELTAQKTKTIPEPTTTTMWRFDNRQRAVEFLIFVSQKGLVPISNGKVVEVENLTQTMYNTLSHRASLNGGKKVK